MQSPAAKIAGSEVRPWSSTTMPSCDGEPGGLRQRVVRHGAGADHDQIGRDRVAASVIDREAAVRRRRSAATRSRRADIDAARAVALVDQRGGLLVADPRQDARRDLDHRDLDAELGRRGGDLEPDHAAADHDQRLRELPVEIAP